MICDTLATESFGNPVVLLGICAAAQGIRVADLEGA
jgi:hypothetical protein